jgi:putative membrane protein
MTEAFMITRLPAIALGLLLITPLRAQEHAGNPAGDAPDTPGAESGHPGTHANDADHLFIKQASIGGMAEVEAGKLAQQRAQRPAVKDFARQMVTDHTKANDGLRPLQRAINSAAPKDLDMDHKVMRAQLSALKGDAFDHGYLQAQVTDHQKTAQLLEWEIGSGQSDQVKAYAKATLPIVLDHLRHAQTLLTQVASAGNRE